MDGSVPGRTIPSFFMRNTGLPDHPKRGRSAPWARENPAGLLQGRQYVVSAHLFKSLSSGHDCSQP